MVSYDGGRVQAPGEDPLNRKAETVWFYAAARTPDAFFNLQKNSEALPRSFRCFSLLRRFKLPGSSFNQAGPQTGSTHVHLPGSAVYFNPYGLYVRFPHLVRPSMGMANCIAKVDSFLANRAFCHDRTSLTPTWLPLSGNPQHLYLNRKKFFLQAKFLLFCYH